MPQAHSDNLRQRLNAVRRVCAPQLQGRIAELTGLTVEARDFPAPVGAQCRICTRTADDIPAEVIGFRRDVSVLMPLGPMEGIARGDRVVCLADMPTVSVGVQLLGRVIDGAGRPIDGKGPLLCQTYRSIHSAHIGALQRIRIDTPIGTGVRAIDAMTTCGRGQRMGIFSGPGVGKSVLLGMIARNTAADVSVIALVGERGREVREFIEKDLGPEGLARSVVVVSTSDEPAPLRVRAGFVAATIAEFFRDQHADVLFLMDSVTRIAMAQRQIGLALGEPPATKGFTPSVFALLPRLVERCGRTAVGSVTGFFSVLVEGDDLSEPVSDAMRGLLDGHLWLSRSLANRAHYPAIDVLESISRIMVDVVNPDHRQAAATLTRLVAVYRDIEDLVNIGAYAAGANAEYDLAVNAKPAIDDFLRQNIDEKVAFDTAARAVAELAAALTADQPAAPAQQPQTAPQPRAEATGRPSAQLERMMAGV